MLKKGLNLDLSIAIDFTASNGYPDENDSLHRIKYGFVNNYEKAIREHYNIISTYNKKDKYDVYGFGADIDGEFKEIFNINGKEDPSITGIDNINVHLKNIYESGELDKDYFEKLLEEIREIRL